MRALAIAFLAACGGGGSSAGTGPLTRSEAEPLCVQNCQRQATCNGGGDVTICASDCIERIEGWMRKDAYTSLVECRETVACFGDETSCQADIVALVPHHDFETKCREKLAGCLFGQDLDFTCEVDFDSTMGDFGPGRLRFVAFKIVRELSACLDLTSCEDKQLCFQDTFNGHHIDLFGF